MGRAPRVVLRTASLCSLDRALRFVHAVRVDGSRISVDVKVNPDDVKAYQVYMKRLPINRPPQRVVRLAGALSLAVYVVFLVGMFSVGAGVWGAWLMLGAYLAQSLVCPLMARRHRAAIAETFHGRLTIEPSALTMDRPGYTSRVLPTAIVDVTIAERHFFVCIGMGRAWMVPRRCFESVEDLAAAESILRDVREQRVPLPESSA